MYQPYQAQILGHISELSTRDRISKYTWSVCRAVVGLCIPVQIHFSLLVRGILVSGHLAREDTGCNAIDADSCILLEVRKTVGQATYLDAIARMPSYV